jgi:hypothetical protein
MTMPKEKSRRKLVGRIMLALVLGVVWPGTGRAEKEEHTTSYVKSGGKSMFEVLYFNPGDAWTYVNPDKTIITLIGTSEYEMLDKHKKALEKGLSYWVDMLAPRSKNTQPFQIMVTTNVQFANASAGTWGLDFAAKEWTYENYMQKVLQDGYTLTHLDPFNGTTPTGLAAFSNITIGEYLGAVQNQTGDDWHIDAETVLPTNEQAADYLGTVRHEMGHALGIIKNVDCEVDAKKDAKLDPMLNQLAFFTKTESTGKNAWNMHLVDQNLNKAQPGMHIVTNNYFNTVIKTSNPNAKVSDYFIVDNLYTKAPYDTTNPRAGKLYFVGDNVTKVLNGSTFDGVSGLPINGWEAAKDKNGKYYYQPEFSHIQTPGMMSHVAYSNYTSFMEVELAVMQDLGYNFDRKNYFGFSEYGNDHTYVNKNGYSARNAAGTAYMPGEYNTTSLGIGFHVYGSRNNITQAADILTMGDGAAGIRIDGAGNTVTIDENTQVRSDGYRGIGTLIAYGNNQILNQYGTISADGEKGVGVQFDFGSSSNGARDEYRGSYIRYVRDVDVKTGDITNGNNLDMMQANGKTPATPELNGSMVKEYNLAGKLSGTANAVYIGKNAFVENINVLPGAAITGNITSDWKQFDTDGSYDGIGGQGALQIQYKGKSYKYSDYIPELVTQLNFAANINYSGNITGEENMKINVNSGVLNYSGTANVVAVNIAKGASLLGGGTYTLHDCTDKMVVDFTDDTTGILMNNGTFGATTGDVKIEGALLSKGSIGVGSADNGERVYLVQVAGVADISDNTLAAPAKNKPLFDKKYNYLTASNGIMGNIVTSNLSDYVQATGSVEGNSAFFTAKRIKNLGDTKGLNGNSLSVARAFDGVADRKMEQGGVTGQQAANVYYNSASDMKTLMNSVTAAERTKLLGQTPMSSLTSNTIYSRLDTNAFDGMLGVPVQVPSLDGENKTVNANVPIALDANNNFWLKMFRGFEGYGGSDGESDLNNQSFGGVVGYDKAAGKDARIGGFFAYGKTNYSTDYLTGNSSDWRLGFYGDKCNGDWEYQGYVSYGANHYDLDAYTSDAGAKLNSDFKAKIWDVGLKAKYTIPSTKEKTWKIRPYGELGYTHTSQDSYTESGSSAFAKNIESASNNSTRAELGVEFKRRITPTSGWGGSIGYKRILSGANPELNGTFIGGTDSFTVKTENDRNYLTYNLNAYTSLGGKWTGQAEIRGEKSSNNHKEVYSISAKYHF